MCSIRITVGEISCLLRPASWWGISLVWYHTAIAHSYGQLTVVIDMGYGNGVWSDQELTTGGACVRYAKVIKHNGEERGIPQTYYTARTKKWCCISGHVCTVKLFHQILSLQAIEIDEQYCILTVLDIPERQIIFKKTFLTFQETVRFLLKWTYNWCTIQSLTSVNLPSKYVISNKASIGPCVVHFISPHCFTYIYCGDKK